MRQWRLLYHSPVSGAYNMGIDEALLTLSDMPTLRFYAWAPPCVSLGYGQKASDIDFDRVHAAGWDVVRRPTGGRAILHIDELTYSLTLPLDHPIAAGGIVESYRRISGALVRGLEHIGLSVQADRRVERVDNTSAVCFETPSHYEVLVNGRKLIGSAQVRRGNWLLQHGSLPLFGDMTRICDVLMYPDETSREAAREHVRARALTLADALGLEHVEWQDAADTLRLGFEEVFDVEFLADELNPSEQQSAQAAAGIYASQTWILRR